MKISDLIERRQEQWNELEALMSRLTSASKSDARNISRFSTLYRAACADLALAESYQLPPKTVEYLHQLVARAHNRFYRTDSWSMKKLFDVAFVKTPQKIFADPCVHIVFVIFWGLFLGSAYLAYEDTLWPDFATEVVSRDQLDMMVEQFEGFEGRTWGENVQMFGFYIVNNAGIGLMCFASSILVIPGLATLASNAVILGTSFGYMFRDDVGSAGVNFKSFVTAHGPFELTAVVLSAGAGLRLGVSWISTGQFHRFDSIKRAGKEMLPIGMCAFVLFVFAAVIEGFISPTPSAYMRWEFKGFIAVLTSCLMAVYFVILGFPRESTDAT